MAESFITEHGLGWILILAAVFVLAIFFLVIIAPNLGILDFVSALLQGQGTPPAPEAVMLQKALECSYYRCFKGCDSNEIKKLKYSSEGLFFDCLEFCKQEFTDTGETDGKVCDENAKEHPVTVEVTSSGGEKISSENLKFFTCMQETNTCDTGKDLPNFLYVDKSALKENTQTSVSCSWPGSVRIQGFSAAIISEGAYKIWTHSYDILSGGGDTRLCIS